ncbi:MAG: hypothetical protein ACF8XB_04580 [Planctomycetota bacterium JB042]
MTRGGAFAVAAAVAAAASVGGLRATSPPAAAPGPALPAPPPGPVATEAAVRLDATNAWTLERSLRDVEVTFEIDPSPRSVLEVRLRAPAIERAEGVALLVSNDPRVPVRFVRETATRFTPIGPWSDALRGRVGTPTVRVVARGDRLEAYLGDGDMPVVSAQDDVFREGGVVLVAARGEVTVRDLRVIASTPSPASEDRAADGRIAARIASAIGPWAWLVALAFVRRRGQALPLPAAAAGAAAALVPFSTALLLPPPVTAWGELGRGALIAFGVAATLRVGLRGSPSDPARLAGVGLAFVAAGGTAAAVLARTDRPAPLVATAYAGTRLEPGFLDLAIPAVRAGMPWLATHSFSGATLDPDDGRPRVWVVGRADAGAARELSSRLGAGVAVLDGTAPRGGRRAAQALLDLAGEAVRPAVVLLAGGATPDVDRLPGRHLRPRFRRTFVDRLVDEVSTASAAEREESERERLADLERRCAALGAALVVAEDPAAEAVASAVAARLGEQGR